MFPYKIISYVALTCLWAYHEMVGCKRLQQQQGVVHLEAEEQEVEYRSVRLACIHNPTAKRRELI